MAFNDEIMVANGDEQHTGSLSIEHKAEASQNYYSPDDATENTLDDADYIPFYDKSAEAKKNTLLSKIWDYIKNKLGIAESGDTYLKKDGTWGTPDKGSTVSYSASLTSGTTIGTLTINGTNYTLYCKGSTVSYSASLTSGTTIGTLTINGTNYTLYCPKAVTDLFDSSTNGLCPAGGTLDRNRVLCNDGTWGLANDVTVNFTSLYDTLSSPNEVDITKKFSGNKEKLSSLFNKLTQFCANQYAIYTYGYDNAANQNRNAGSFKSGYITNTGSIAYADSTMKEMYLNGTIYIGSSSGLIAEIALINVSSQAGWISMAYYNSTNTFISRPQSIGYNSGAAGQLFRFFFYPPSGAFYAKVTFRSYGNARVSVYKLGFNNRMSVAQ